MKIAHTAFAPSDKRYRIGSSWDEQNLESLSSRSTDERSKACDNLGNAVDDGTVGQTVAKHERLILTYYEDVEKQAKQSFDSAKRVAQIGFWVLIATLGYLLVFDALNRIPIRGIQMAQVSKTVVSMGVVSGALIEFIAAINFWLYASAARHFSAFHICLERTHRYLLAYKMAEEIATEKDDTLRRLVCIMANAPMITQKDLNTGVFEAIPKAEKTAESISLAAL